MKRSSRAAATACTTGHRSVSQGTEKRTGSLPHAAQAKHAVVAVGGKCLIASLPVQRPHRHPSSCRIHPRLCFPLSRSIGCRWFSSCCCCSSAVILAGSRCSSCLAPDCPAPAVAACAVSDHAAAAASPGHVVSEGSPMDAASTAAANCMLIDYQTPDHLLQCCSLSKPVCC